MRWPAPDDRGTRPRPRRRTRSRVPGGPRRSPPCTAEPAASSAAPPSTEERLVARQWDPFLADGCQQRVAASQGHDLVLPELHHPRVVAGPGGYRPGKCVDPVPPVGAVGIADLPRSDQADVDVAVRRAVLPSGAAEEVGGEGRGVQAVELGSKLSQQLVPEM